MWEAMDFHGALPYPGALWQQPAGMIRRMRKAYEVWNVYRSFRLAKSWKKWSEANPDYWSLKCAVDKLRQTWPTPD